MADFGGDAEPFRAEARSWLEASFPASLRRGAGAPVDPEAAALVRTISLRTPSPSSDASAEAASLSRLLGEVAGALASALTH